MDGVLDACAASPLALSHDGYAASGCAPTWEDYQPSLRSPWLAAYAGEDKQKIGSINLVSSKVIALMSIISTEFPSLIIYGDI